MTHKFGSDLMLDETGDLIVSALGDLMDTDFLEASIPEEDLPFEGYTRLKETAYNVIISEKRDFVYDIDTGANTPLYISQPMNSKFDDLKESIRQELLKDDCVENVPDIIVTKYPADNMATIEIFIKAMGIEKVSSLVFPYSLIGNN